MTLESRCVPRVTDDILFCPNTNYKPKAVLLPKYWSLNWSNQDIYEQMKPFVADKFCVIHLLMWKDFKTISDSTCLVLSFVLFPKRSFRSSCPPIIAASSHQHFCHLVTAFMPDNCLPTRPPPTWKTLPLMKRICTADVLMLSTDY